MDITSKLRHVAFIYVVKARRACVGKYFVSDFIIELGCQCVTLCFNYELLFIFISSYFVIVTLKGIGKVAGWALTTEPKLLRTVENIYSTLST